jgi:broad specificity phosphatase PhoE
VTTLLARPLTREVLLGGEPFKVVLSPEGITITQKGRRKGQQVRWGVLLALGESAAPRLRPEPASDVPTAIATDVASDLRRAAQALAAARATLGRAGQVPLELLKELEPDPVYGRVEERNDWYIEPLLTPQELASILRLSQRSVQGLQLRSVNVGGETRYRQSDVRRYLAAQMR